MAVSKDWLVCAVVLLCLVTYGESVRDDCPLAVAPANDSTGFLGYATDQITTPGGPDTVCNSTLFCNGTISPGKFQRRSWFITDVKDDIGLWYLPEWIQRHNVVCPKNHVLSLVPQQINTGQFVSGTPCSTSVDDTVTVTSGANVTVSCGTEFDNVLENFGRGQHFFGRPVQVDFCTVGTNIPARNSGFVIRATCFNPCDFALKGCTDFAFFDRWDPEFISNFVNATFPTIDRMPLRHRRKRSEEIMEKNIDKINKHLIQKRGLRKVLRTLDEGDTVTYINSTIIITDGVTGDQERISDVICLVTSNPLIKTRKFFRNFDRGYPLRTFTGPGELTVFGFVGTLFWTIPDPETYFLPSVAVANIVNRIYDYIYQQWYRPFPLIAVPDENPLVFPLPNATDVITPRRRSTDVDVIFPKLNTTDLPSCRRAAILNLVPLLNATIADSQVRFCRLFDTACDLSLQTACRELLALRAFYAV